jgi:hypothetical protein
MEDWEPVTLGRSGDAVLNPAFASIVIDLPMDPWRLEFYRLLDEFF